LEFCGSYKSTIDPKWRLKIPAEYREYLYSKYGDTFYVASLDLETLLVFPQPVYEQLKIDSATNPELSAMMPILSLSGRSSKADGQGKVMIPELVRIKCPSLKGQVIVAAVVDHLEVYTLETIDKIFERIKITNEQFARIRAGGKIDRS
jgi:DNA-binding transcriptional regulator/RsmH inhibitor MraZ